MHTAILPRRALRAERDYFLAFIILGVIGVLLGFVPPSWLRFQGQADYPAPLALQIHAGLFLGWVALITTQVLFVRHGQIGLHRRLGAFGAALIPAMAISSVFAETYSEKFAAIHAPGQQRFLIIPIFSLGLFLVFTIAGLVLRRDAELHRRLIFLGTALLFGAAWSRVTGPLLKPYMAYHGMGFFIRRFLMTDVLLVLLAVMDWRVKGRLQPVTAIGITVIVAAEIVITPLYFTDWWLGVTDTILAAFPGP